MVSPELERPDGPFAIRLFNWVGRRLERCGVCPDRLTEASILRAARRQARLSDFGDDGFRVPLRRLVQSCRDEARLHPFGRVLMWLRLIELVANRLKIRDELKRHPEILEVPIRRPLFVLGLPRTGTTLLYNLLAQDPASRPLLTWEAFWPAPPPERDTRDTDPRIRQARILVKLTHWLAPRFPLVHQLTPDGPEECTFLTMNTFVSPGFLMLADLPGYEAWLWSLGFEERVAAYEDYRRQLQLLQWRCSADHWVLKSPVHSTALDALLHLFPDACAVQTHRDPARVVPSLCSLFSILRGMGSDEIDPLAMGPRIAETCAEIVGRAMAARDAAPDRVLDVRYPEIIGDPIGTVHRIYEHFGYERDDRMDARMKRWLAENPRHKEGVHRYDLGQFGLHQGDIDRLFGPYRERYAIARE